MICFLFKYYCRVTFNDVEPNKKLVDKSSSEAIIIIRRTFTNEYIRNYHVPISREKLPPEIAMHGDQYIEKAQFFLNLRLI